jgi:hypothetical protein
MTLAKAKAKANETFIVQASLLIVTYDRQNIFIVQANHVFWLKLGCLPQPEDTSLLQNLFISHK